MTWLITEILNKISGNIRKSRSLLNGIAVSFVERMKTKSNIISIKSSSPYITKCLSVSLGDFGTFPVSDHDSDNSIS